jgi:hypothetical protein
MTPNHGSTQFPVRTLIAPVERGRAAGRLLDDVDRARLSPAIHARTNLDGRYHIHPDRPPRRLVPGRDGLATYK